MADDVRAMGWCETTSVFCFPCLRIGRTIADVHEGGYILRAPDVIVETEEVVQDILVQALEESHADPIFTGRSCLSAMDGLLKFRKLEGTVNHIVARTSVVLRQGHMIISFTKVVSKDFSLNMCVRD